MVDGEGLEPVQLVEAAVNGHVAHEVEGLQGAPCGHAVPLLLRRLGLGVRVVRTCQLGGVANGVALVLRVHVPRVLLQPRQRRAQVDLGAVQQDAQQRVGRARVGHDLEQD